MTKKTKSYEVIYSNTKPKERFTELQELERKIEEKKRKGEREIRRIEMLKKERKLRAIQRKRWLERKQKRGSIGLAKAGLGMFGIGVKPTRHYKKRRRY